MTRTSSGYSDKSVVMRAFGLLLVSLLLSGCYTGFNLQELKQADPQGSAYHKELAALYLMYSEAEADNADWRDSQYFAGKGLRAIYGHEVQPEVVERWDIHGGALVELKQARDELLPLLSDAVKEAQPVAAAQAVFYFDCWVENQEEYWKQQPIAACKEGLYHAMKELMPANVAEADVVVGKPEVPEIESTAYMLFFAHNAIDLNAEALATLESVAKELQGMQEEYTVVINGHADRSGNEKLNLEIALNRAEAARGKLVELGVPDARIQVFSFGESAPAVATRDDVEEAKNRRVEIYITQ